MQTHLGITPQPIQLQTMYSVLQNKRTDVKTANEVGKTYGFAMTALWFLYAFGPYCSVVVTSSTDRQLWRQFWAEVKQMYFNRKVDLGGRMMEKYLEVRKDVKWFMVAFSTKDEATFEGWHNENILLIFDESKGIPDQIWRGGERVLRGKGGIKRWLVGGTPPLAPIGEFCQISLNPKKAANWNHLNCTGWESPIVSDEACQMSLDQYGERNPFYQSMVLGKIPQESDNTMINIIDVEKAAMRDHGPCGAMEVGVDVARMGEDETVIALRNGLNVSLECKAGIDRVNWTVGRVKKLLQGFDTRKEIPIKVDDTGVGGGVTDLLLAEGYNAIPINFGMKAEDPDHFYNWGTEMYHHLAKITASEEISIPDDPVLKAQLYQRTIIKYTQKAGNVVMKLLSKEDLRKDKTLGGMGSPDRADAVALAFSPIPIYDSGQMIGSSEIIQSAQGW